MKYIITLIHLPYINLGPLKGHYSLLIEKSKIRCDKTGYWDQELVNQNTKQNKK